jgi:hypothetical protein
MNMGRKILAVIVGWIVAMTIITIGQMLMATMWSPPPTAVRSDPEILRAYMQELPTEAFIALLVIYAIASFGGGFIVTKMGRRVSSGTSLPFIIATLLFLGGILNFFYMVPYHPLWVSILGLAIFYPFTLLGYKFAR